MLLYGFERARTILRVQVERVFTRHWHGSLVGNVHGVRRPYVWCPFDVSTMSITCGTIHFGGWSLTRTRLSLVLQRRVSYWTIRFMVVEEREWHRAGTVRSLPWFCALKGIKRGLGVIGSIVRRPTKIRWLLVLHVGWWRGRGLSVLMYRPLVCRRRWMEKLGKCGGSERIMKYFGGGEPKMTMVELRSYVRGYVSCLIKGDWRRRRFTMFCFVIEINDGLYVLRDASSLFSDMYIWCLSIQWATHEYRYIVYSVNRQALVN